MAYCFVCNKKGFHTYTLKDYWRSPQTPEGMTKDDFVCVHCYHKVKKLVLEYKNENKKEIDRLNSEEKEKEKEKEKAVREREKVSERAERERLKLEEEKIISKISNNYHKYNVVIYKDEYCALLHRISGQSKEIQFIKEFSDLTREGYRMMAQDEGGSLNLGIGTAGIDSTYFFQKIEYITQK